MNRNLEDLDSWLKCNKLSLHIVKTQSMLITTKPRHRALSNATDNLKLEVLGYELDVVRKTRYLCVRVDNSLDWKEQIKSISSKVSRVNAFLKYAKNILPIAAVKTLYEPHI